jgi:hypothetical protein
MIVLAAAIIGAAFGAWRARTRGGSRADMAQYGAGHGIAFAIVALFAGIAWEALV